MPTVKEIKSALDELGVEYKSSERKASLQRKLTIAEKEKLDEEIDNALNEVEEEVETETLKLPEFEHAQVLEVLSGGHTKTHFHCRMDNGTTMHVPKHLF